MRFLIEDTCYQRESVSTLAYPNFWECQRQPFLGGVRSRSLSIRAPLLHPCCTIDFQDVRNRMGSMHSKDPGSVSSQTVVVGWQSTHILRTVRSSLLRLAAPGMVDIIAIAPGHMETAFLVDIHAIDVSCTIRPRPEETVWGEGLTHCSERPSSKCRGYSIHLFHTRIATRPPDQRYRFVDRRAKRPPDSQAVRQSEGRSSIASSAHCSTSTPTTHLVKTLIQAR